MEYVTKRTLNEIYYSALLSDYQYTLQETQGWNFMMRSWLVSSCMAVEPHCSTARSRNQLEKSEEHWMQETMILYPMLLILQVHIFVRENTKAIKKNKFTMPWWTQIIVRHCIHASLMYSLPLATYHKRITNIYQDPNYKIL